VQCREAQPGLELRAVSPQNPESSCDAICTAASSSALLPTPASPARKSTSAAVRTRPRNPPIKFRSLSARASHQTGPTPEPDEVPIPTHQLDGSPEHGHELSSGQRDSTWSALVGACSGSLRETSATPGSPHGPAVIVTYGSGRLYPLSSGFLLVEASCSLPMKRASRWVPSALCAERVDCGDGYGVERLQGLAAICRGCGVLALRTRADVRSGRGTPGRGPAHPTWFTSTARPNSAWEACDILCSRYTTEKSSNMTLSISSLTYGSMSDE
jgi:hypothetical protein